MVRFITFLCGLFLCMINTALGQSIQGHITDTDSKVNLHNATIVLLQQKDSILHAFTRSDKAGKFKINTIDTGKYILLVSYPDYADFTKPITMGAANSIDLGNIILIKKETLLKEVVVKAGAAIRIKGDTTEFIADSFKVAAGANVEDLLKKFPGIQIDQNGKITAQGQTVKKVLIDGEEFFGDDPTLVTRNFKAEMVDKVQLYDKKSEEATFTGIDDGVREKTLNVKLKKGYNKGIIGEVKAGIAHNKLYDNKIVLNKFKDKERLSIFGILANNGTSGLNYGDEVKYGFQSAFSNMEMGADGTITIMSMRDGDDIFGGYYSGKGILETINTGLQYSNKWQEDAHNLNISYRPGKAFLEDRTRTLTLQNFENGKALNNEKSELSHKTTIQNKGNLQYLWQIDSTLKMNLKVNAKTNNSHIKNDITSSTTNELDELVNKEISHNESTATANNLSTVLFLGKKMRKEGRLFSATLQYDHDILQSQKSIYNQYTFGLNNTTQLLDQQKNTQSKASQYQAKALYIEPLSKKWQAFIGYNYNNQVSNSMINTYNKDHAGKYTVIDDYYSNNYELKQTIHSPAIGFTYNHNKKHFSIKTDIGNMNSHMINKKNHDVIQRDFLVFKSNLSFGTSITSNMRGFVNYMLSNQQPTLTQMQPSFITEDTMNIYIGNPNLKASIQQSININLNSYSILSQRGFFLYAYYREAYNSITTNASTDFTTGRKTYSYFNYDKPLRSGNISVSYNFKDKNSIDYDINHSYYVGQYFGSNNNQLYKTTNQSYSLRLGANKSFNEKLLLSLNNNVSYNHYTTTLKSAKGNNGFSNYSAANITLTLPKQWQLESNISHQWQQKTASFEHDFNKTLWNFSVEKSFFKEKNLQVKLSCRDILNQNNGFSRSAYDNAYIQTNYISIGRYLMLSLTWKPNRNAKQQKL